MTISHNILKTKTGRFCFVAYLSFVVGLSFLPRLSYAADYSVQSIGDWTTDFDNPETLAGVLQLIEGGDTAVTLTANAFNSGAWDNWASGNGYSVLFKLGDSVTADNINFDLGGFTLAGTSLDINTGTSTFSFTNGTLGSTAYAFGIGVNGDATVSLDSTVYLNASALTIGSATTRTQFSSAGEINSAGNITVTGQNTTFLSSGSVTASGTVSIKNGADASFSAGSLTANQVLVDSGASFELSGGTSTLGTLSVSDGSSVTISNGSSLAATTLVDVSDSSSLSLLDGSLTSAALSVNESLVTVSGSNSVADITNALSLSSGSSLTLSSGGQIMAGSLSVGGSTVTVSGAGVLDITGTLSLSADSSMSLSNSTLTAGTLSVNGQFTSTNGSITVNNLIVDGVSFTASADTPPTYTATQSKITGSGSLEINSALSVLNGSSADISGFDVTSQSAFAITVDGYAASPDDLLTYRSSLKIADDINADSVNIAVINGGLLSGANNISVSGTGNLNISGAVIEEGFSYRSTLNAGGSLSIFDGGSVSIANGGILTGITSIDLAKTGAGSLTITGSPASGYASNLAASGALTIGEQVGSNGTLLVSGSGFLSTVGTANLGVLGNATVTIQGNTENGRSTWRNTGNFVTGAGEVSFNVLSGAYAQVTGSASVGNDSTNLASVRVSGASNKSNATWQVQGGLTVADTGDASVRVENGGAISVTGNTVLANEDGTTAMVTMTGGTWSSSGGLTVGKGDDTTVNVTMSGGTLSSSGGIVLGAGEDSTVNVTMTGGAWSSGNGSTILGQAEGSVVKISMSGASWSAGGSASAFTPSLGNTSLSMSGGTFGISGLFSMAGHDDTYANGFGVASFTGSTLNINGSFYNMNTSALMADSLGRTVIQGGATLSGRGSIIAGEYIQIFSSTITPGTRSWQDFNAANDNLTGLGTLNLHSSQGVLFDKVKFQTQLDWSDLSDKVVVYGDLSITDTFTIDIDRILDGKYLLVETDGGVISDYAAKSIADFLTSASSEFTLNGKSIKGNDRIDFASGLYTSLEDSGTKLYLNVDSLTDGNQEIYWVGNESSVWNMVSKNFDDTNTANTKQFLDGDTVIFDSDVSQNNDIVITGDSIYGGNVIVNEVQVLGDSDFSWSYDSNGKGSIIAYDSPFYTTLDSKNPDHLLNPSGALIKVGDGTLTISNSNEFYGGIYLGDIFGNSGGKIVIKNTLALGSYDSGSGFLKKGVIFVNENSMLELDDGISISNRFVIGDGKTLTIAVPGDLMIYGNNALSDLEEGAGGINGGRGGGLFISDKGLVIYMSSTDGTMTITENKAKYGGGIYAMQGYALDAKTIITENYASISGGGIYAEKDFEISPYAVVEQNFANSYGGGIYVGGTNQGQTLTVHGGVEIIGNLTAANYGAGLYIDGGYVADLVTAYSAVDSVLKRPEFLGGDIWIEGNYAKVSVDPDAPQNISRVDTSEGILNGIHLAYSNGAGASLNIKGPYNTYLYDGITGDSGTNILMQGILAVNSDPDKNTSHTLASGQMGTMILRNDSAFYGNTTVSDGATIRLESYENSGETVEAVYGRSGANTFTLASDSFLTGEGQLLRVRSI